jgi:hypothetical protein
MSIYILWLFSIILFFTLPLVTLYIMTRGKRLTRYITTGLFCFAIVGGFLFYTRSHLPDSAGIADTMATTLRAIFNTNRMFFLNADYSVLDDVGIRMQIVFWLCHLSALLIFNVALLSLLGRKITEQIRLWLGWYREIYIIRGSENYAILLGENIATDDHPQKSPNHSKLILFLVDESVDVKKMAEQIVHFSGIVRVLDRKHNLPFYLHLTGMGRKNITRKSYSFIRMPSETSAIDDISSICEYAKQNNIPQGKINIYTFVSSEWDKAEIEAFTHTQRVKPPATFHIISEADLLIRQMIENHPPYKCPALDFNEIGIAKRSLNVLVIGFGSIGQHALLHLIKNGQFVIKPQTKMSAIVIDKDIEFIRERFELSHPAIDISCDVSYYDYDIRCSSFFRLLSDHQKLCSIDYIVVALDSNIENKQVAVDIRLFYQQLGINLPFMAVYERHEGMHFKQFDENVFTFGCRDEIYRESIIIREELNHKAKNINKTYSEVYGGREWHKLDWFTQESNRASADFIPAMLFIAKTTPETAISNGSLTTNSEHFEILSKTEHLRWNAFHVVMGYRPFSLEEMSRRFVEFSGEQNSEKHLEYARRDIPKKLHVCITTWEELDEVSAIYRELEVKTGREGKRCFKENDRDNIRLFPKFLKK